MIIKCFPSKDLGERLVYDTPEFEPDYASKAFGIPESAEGPDTKTEEAAADHDETVRTAIETSGSERKKIDDETKEKVRKALGQKDVDKAIGNLAKNITSYKRGNWKDWNEKIGKQMGETNPQEIRKTVRAYQQVLFRELGLTSDPSAVADGKIDPYTLAAMAAYAKKQLPTDAVPSPGRNTALANKVIEVAKELADNPNSVNIAKNAEALALVANGGSAMLNLGGREVGIEANANEGGTEYTLKDTEGRLLGSVSESEGSHIVRDKNGNEIASIIENDNGTFSIGKDRASIGQASNLEEALAMAASEVVPPTVNRSASSATAAPVSSATAAPVSSAPIESTGQNRDEQLRDAAENVNKAEVTVMEARKRLKKAKEVRDTNSWVAWLGLANLDTDEERVAKREKELREAESQLTTAKAYNESLDQGDPTRLAYSEVSTSGDVPETGYNVPDSADPQLASLISDALEGDGNVSEEPERVASYAAEAEKKTDS